MEGCQVDGPNGNAIFLPATGHYEESGLIYAGTRGNYWSSSLYPDISKDARSLFLNSSGRHELHYYNRSIGFSVRPVRP